MYIYIVLVKHKRVISFHAGKIMQHRSHREALAPGNLSLPVIVEVWQQNLEPSRSVEFEKTSIRDERCALFAGIIGGLTAQ